MTSDRSADDFSRLHKQFVFHLGMAASLAWASAAATAFHVPWVRNIRALIDPFSAQAESTWSFLFGLPIVLALAWVSLAFGSDLLSRARLMKNQQIEFAIAGVVAFAVFCMAINRCVTAFLLG